MEGKKLNFNRPLISVRRYSSTVANSQKDSKKKNETSLLPSPSYKSEMHSGPLRDPGSVPFVWEQIPGRPKDETIPQKHPIVPKLPPGRISKPEKQDLQRSHSREDDYDYDYDDDVYMDAIGTPPRTRIKDKAREVKKVVNMENEKPQITYGPNFLQLNEDDNDEDSSDQSDYDEHENMSYKVCGLFPHFCLKGSIGLLNPIPGLSVKTKLPISSSANNRTHAGSSSASSRPQPQPQAARAAVYEHKSLVKNKKDEPVLKNESTEATNQKIPEKLQGSGLYDRLQNPRISHFNPTESSQHPVSERKDVNLQKKGGLVSFKELLAYDNEKEADSQNPAIEKTLYVDTVHKVEYVKSDFKEDDVGSQMPTEPFKSDLLSDKLKQDKEMITQTDVCKEKVKVSRQSGLGLPAPPPLPKSPSDSWLWRTLPSKTASLRSNPSNTTAKSDKNAQSRYPQGLLLPIPES